MGWIVWGALAVVGFGIAFWFALHVRAVLRGDYQRGDDVDVPWWIPGNGGYGGGTGQVPPVPPYREEWDPENRIP